MKYHELTIITKPRAKKRVGRGISAGQGKTAGRGTKGQGSRAGSSKNPGFAGGQNPLMQQLPKLAGFKSHKIKPEIIKTSALNKLPNTNKPITANELFEQKLISNPFVKVKLLFDQPLTSAINLQISHSSKTAIDALEQSGGSFTRVDRISRLAKTIKE